MAASLMILTGLSSGREIETHPAGPQVLRLEGRFALHHGSGIADRDHVELPIAGLPA